MRCDFVSLVFCMTVVARYAETSGQLNEYCKFREDCKSIGYVCWRNFTCQCQSPAYIPNRKHNRCMGIIDQKCKYDEHCIESAFCFQQRICQCKDDYYPSEDNTICLSANAAIKNPFIPTLLLLTTVALSGLG